MKIIEESILKENIEQFNNYKKAYLDIDSFYSNLDNLALNSLQSFSFSIDDAFFNEIAFILNVISSIISHPHLSNKGEDVVMRSELAGHISTESLQRVFKEPSFWKEKDLEMAPEYVHHYQYTDDIKIYENIFIGMVIKVIDSEVMEYIDFYNQLIPSIDDDNSNCLLEDTDIEVALKKLNFLRKKVRYIKNTYFFKEVSKVRLSLKNIEPTNILIKDRLYNYCYQFYKKFIQYVDKEILIKDFNTYYYLLVIKAMKEKGFILLNDKENTLTNLNLYYDVYYTNVSLDMETNTILLKVGLNDSSYISTHGLVLTTERNVEDLIVIDKTSVLTTFIATIWNIKDSNDLTQFIFKNRTLEASIASYWVNNKFIERAIKEKLYTKYCPVCKGDNLDEEEGLYCCNDCGSIYTFKKENLAWFLRLRGM